MKHIELLYRLLLDNIRDGNALRSLTQPCGNRQEKNRLTVMLCTNMDGEFEKSIEIGKARMPCCFWNLQVSDLPVTRMWEGKRMDDF